MIISFEDELGPMHFTYVFEGFVLGGSITEKKGLSILRREFNILEKLEGISHVLPCGRKLPSEELARELDDKMEGNAPRQIQIDEYEFDILFTYITLVPWKTGASLKNALNTIDWLVRIQRGAL